MKGDPALSALRDEVLKKIGRNVLYFQKMEAMLKLLISQRHVNGALADIPALQAKNVGSIARHPMGCLATTFIKEVFAGGGKYHGSPEDEFTLSFRMAATPELAAQRRKALASLVEDRNKLIHQWLAKFDPNSIASCEVLSTMLDDQYARIRPEYELLRTMLLAFRDLREKMRAVLASDGFWAAAAGDAGREARE